MQQWIYRIGSSAFLDQKDGDNNDNNNNNSTRRNRFWTLREKNDVNSTRSQTNKSPVSALMSPAAGIQIVLPVKFYDLSFFGHDWEEKWHFNRDFLQSNDPVIRQHYSGGDYTKLIDLHMDTVRAILREKKRSKSYTRLPKALRRTTKHKHTIALLTKQNIGYPFSNIEDAFQYAKELYTELGSSKNIYNINTIGSFINSGYLPFPVLLQLSYKIFIRFIPDAQYYLTAQEWEYMADSLCAICEKYEMHALTCDVYVFTLLYCVLLMLLLIPLI